MGSTAPPTHFALTSAHSMVDRIGLGRKEDLFVQLFYRLKDDAVYEHKSLVNLLAIEGFGLFAPLNTMDLFLQTIYQVEGSKFISSVCKASISPS